MSHQDNGAEKLALHPGSDPPPAGQSSGSAAVAKAFLALPCTRVGLPCVMQEPIAPNLSRNNQLCLQSPALGSKAEVLNLWVVAPLGADDPFTGVAQDHRKARYLHYDS